MPSYRLPGLSAATTLHFIARHNENIHRSEIQQRVLPISAAIAKCRLAAPGRSFCREKNTAVPGIFIGRLCGGLGPFSLTKAEKHFLRKRIDGPPQITDFFIEKEGDMFILIDTYFFQ
jgi:hypothetical protein